MNGVSLKWYVQVELLLYTVPESGRKLDICWRGEVYGKRGGRMITAGSEKG
jgi:hypothetical protein